MFISMSSKGAICSEHAARSINSGSPPNSCTALIPPYEGVMYSNSSVFLLL